MATHPNTPLFGWCGTLDHIGDIHAAGLDYFEAQIVPMSLEDNSAFSNAKGRVADSPLPILAMSYVFPHDFRVIGPYANEPRNRAYFARVVELLVLAKSRVVVVGSGWTRNIPEGWTQAQAEDDYLKMLSWCADALQGTGVTLAIEPLNRKESSLVNSVADGVRLARMLNRPEVKSMADFYHIDEEKEPLDTLLEYGSWLTHIHLADTGRKNPGTGKYDYPTFFGNLQGIGYRGLLSAECSVIGDPVAGMRKSADFLRRSWRNACN